LRSRLAACTTVANKHVEEGLDFIGDGLSASHAINTGTYIFMSHTLAYYISGLYHFANRLATINFVIRLF